MYQHTMMPTTVISPLNNATVMNIPFARVHQWIMTRGDHYVRIHVDNVTPETVEFRFTEFHYNFWLFSLFWLCLGVVATIACHVPFYVFMLQNQRPRHDNAKPPKYVEEDASEVMVHNPLLPKTLTDADIEYKHACHVSEPDSRGSSNERISVDSQRQV